MASQNNAKQEKQQYLLATASGSSEEGRDGPPRGRFVSTTSLSYYQQPSTSDHRLKTVEYVSAETRTYKKRIYPADVGPLKTKWGRLATESTEIDSGGSPDVAIEVEVDEETVAAEDDPVTIEITNNSPASSSSYGLSSKDLQSSSSNVGRRIKRPTQYSAQQLIKFDPMQCFDIDELRNRMIAAQERIEDAASMHLNYNKLKNENGQLREALNVCDHRIVTLESTVMERNERLKEMLRENVFMRAQIKKLQGEFGIDAVKEVFNRRAEKPQNKQQ